MPRTCWDALVDRQEGFVNFTPELHAALARTRVAVIGAGGNGAVLDLLARAGFVRFLIIDPDTVEASNLNRLPFDQSSVGLAKVAAWERHLRGINPDCEAIPCRRGITRADGPWLKKILAGTGLIFLGTTDVEANLVVGRTAAEMGIRMIVGPASSGSCIVSTFTHDGDLDVESVARFGTRGIPLEDIDYKALKPLYAQAMTFPGRRANVTDEAWRGMREGVLAARSCGIFVRLTNAAMAFEGVKNAAELAGLPLRRTRVVAMPVVQVFDPWSGCSYFFNALTGQIGIPDWMDGSLRWETAPRK